MGDIADGLINGDFDFYTGEYIGKGHGYPRTKNGSLPWEGKYDADRAALRVVRHWLTKKMKIQKPDDAIKEYLPGTDKTLKQKATIIQKDFNKFANWVHKNKKK